MAITTINIIYQSSQPIMADINLNELFTGKTATNITSVKWAFKKSRRDADDAILLKELGTGVTKIDVTADDGSVKVRLTLNLSSDDWLKLSSGENYIMAIGVKVDTQSNDDKHVEVFNNRKEIIRVKVVEDSLRA
jgi:hypothetical protein